MTTMTIARPESQPIRSHIPTIARPPTYPTFTGWGPRLI